MPRVLITDCDHGFLDPEREVADERGAELVFAAGDVEAHARDLAFFDALLTQYFRVDGALLKRTPSCRVVGRYGVGIDNIDLEAAATAGVEVINVPDFCTEEVADHTLGLALAALRRISATDRAWHGDPAGFAARWEERFELLEGVERSAGRRFGVYGFGRIGRAVARRATAFGFEVIAHDTALTDEEIRTGGAVPVSIDALLATSDVLSLHIPLSSGAGAVIDAAALASMKDGAVLINTARGALVDEEALVRALRAGRLWAALDVLQAEPPSLDHPLLSEPRAILTPHVAFYSQTSIIELKYKAICGVLDVLAS